MRKVERLFICILVGILLAGCNGIKGTQNVKEGEAVVKKEGDTGTVEKAEPQVEEACCSQGIEYELAKGQKYPKEGENICVTGRFDTYQEGKNTYCTLRDARLEE